MPGTLIYNEGWLLRLALAASARGVDCLPLKFQPNARWFSEALLYSAFLPRFRGDRLAESLTHADAAIGQFVFDASTKAGVVLCTQATQLIVCEAKMFSPLSPGTTHAPNYDQAARNVACMAETLRRAAKPLSRYSSLGFFVLAPASQIKGGLFDKPMSREGVRLRVAERVQMYTGEKRHGDLQRWLEDWVLPLVDRMTLKCCSWESVIERARISVPEYGASLARFYELCLKYNAVAGNA